MSNYSPICNQSSIAKLVQKIVNLHAQKYNYNQEKRVQWRKIHNNKSIHSYYFISYSTTNGLNILISARLLTWLILTSYWRSQVNMVKSRTLNWLSSYLPNRSHQVQVSGHRTNEYNVTFEVTPGSYLDLFLIFFY